MSAKHSFAVFIIHIEASIWNLPGYLSQIPTLTYRLVSNTERRSLTQDAGGGRKLVCEENNISGNKVVLVKGTSFFLLMGLILSIYLTSYWVFIIVIDAQNIDMPKI